MTSKRSSDERDTPKKRADRSTGNVRAVRPMTLRVDDTTRAAIERAAALREISTAEYMRRAIIVQIAWDQAIRTLAAGADPEILLDQQRLAELFARATHDPRD